MDVNKPFVNHSLLKEKASFLKQADKEHVGWQSY